MAKKLVNWGEMIVVWHVDNLTVLHKELFEVTKFSQYFSTIYGNKLKVNLLNIHDYLGMNLEHSETGVVRFSIIKYPQNIL